MELQDLAVINNMDPINQNTNPIPEPMPMAGQSGNSSRLPKKLLLIVGAIVVVGLLAGAAIMLYPKSKQQQPNQTAVKKLGPTITPFVAQGTPAPTATVELQKAIDEAKNSAAEYDTWQVTNLTAYPWLRKFPLASEKYYIYFDLNKKTFIGRLYPKSGDTTDQIKAQIMADFKAKSIPVDTFPFEWVVNPK